MRSALRALSTCRPIHAYGLHGGPHFATTAHALCH
jgi:hypothetical protein